MRLNEPSILLFEDEPIIELDLIRKFKRWGYQSVRTADKIGEEVNLNGLTNGIIICNLRLTHDWVSQDAFNVLLNTDLPLIVLTGLSDSTLCEVDFDRGSAPVCFIYKPFTTQQLKKTLDSLIDS